jgi:glycosyltransferase involved in cell wall biosynthesis
MRVAIVSPSLSRLAGGIFEIERSLTKALSALPQVAVSVHGVDDAFTREDLNAWESSRLETYRLLGPASFGYAPGLGAGLAKSQAEIAHLQALWMYPSIATHRWAVKERKPYIVTTNGMLDSWALRNSGWKKKIAALLYERRNLQAAACLQANTHSELESMRAFGLRNPIAIVPNGVSLPKEVGEGRSSMIGGPESKDDPCAKLRLLFLGRIHPKKGIAELIDGWGLSHARRNGWKLEVAGWDDGGNENGLRDRIARLHLDESVTWTGPLFGEAKERAFRKASAFILPSYSEGLPMTVLEAWSYQLPVLKTPHCNLAEGFKARAAIRIEPRPESIAEGLNSLTAIGESELAEMGRRGRRLVEEKFTWPHVAAEMKAVYDWVLGHGPRPACVIET